MSTRLAARLAVLLAAMAAALGAATPVLAVSDGGDGGGGAATPLPPDQAVALASAPASSGSSTTEVDGGTALAGSTLPGAQTWVESGISPEASVGLAPLNETGAVAGLRPICWANAAWHKWGT
jgi:hypothetical protein